MFADGFAGAHRIRVAPRTGRLAGGGPDGVLYVSDDKAGRISAHHVRGRSQRQGPGGRSRTGDARPSLARGPSPGRHPPRRRSEAHAAAPARHRRRSISGRRSSAVRRPGQLRRLSRCRRHRHAGARRSDLRQVAVGRRQPGSYPLHHRQRRAGAEAASGRHAADGRSDAARKTRSTQSLPTSGRWGTTLRNKRLGFPLLAQRRR